MMEGNLSTRTRLTGEMHAAISNAIEWASVSAVAKISVEHMEE